MFLCTQQCSVAGAWEGQQAVIIRRRRINHHTRAFHHRGNLLGSTINLIMIMYMIL